ncbi:MAG: phosphatase PAP2 family protein [Firmicutes bacterium]|nr:phosphatase PAP2 family protein [Bacillota bacterium]
MKKKILTICIALAVFGFLTWAVIAGKTAGFDDTIRFAFYSVRCACLTVIAKVFTAIGSWWGVTIICLALLFIKKTRLRAGVPVVLAALSAQMVEKIMKALVERPRPPFDDSLIDLSGHSFPSGHATTSMAIFLILIYVVRTQVRAPAAKNLLTILLAVPMICVGLSRIYLGVHYPTDVLGGWALGIALTMICVIIGEGAEERKGRRRY